MKILITGGSSDIASAIIHKLGTIHDVTYTYSSEESYKLCRKRYEKLDRVDAVEFNLSKPVLSNSQFDVIILNACSKLKKLKKLDETSLVDLNEFIQTNLMGNISLLKEVLPYMIDNKFGRIVNISSLSSVLGTANYTPYNILKASLESLMRSIAVDYGSSNIIANSIRLGLFKTSRNKMLWKRSGYQEKVNNKILLRKMGEPSQIVSLVETLIDLNCYISGQEINLAGGLPLPNSVDL